MTYRIRYKQARGAGEAEAVIEANSPTEAIVKFRCTRSHAVSHPVHQDVITSVSAADMPDCMNW